MGTFTEIYSFRLNVVQDTNAVQDANVICDNLSFSFCAEQIEFITKICVCLNRLLRKYKLHFSLKAATPLGINKCPSKCRTGHK